MYSQSFYTAIAMVIAGVVIALIFQFVVPVIENKIKKQKNV